ncbi:DUF3267 domain-containing protein [Salipaludibacillus daqingensis]|uniref:DUF3267 domain-containing protein n=1 Tax=Salipaludibacillus daqingensis TaxID=3041001 RepID=UPI00247326CA|nr:DUF3267 domain-containing protein [Salipaludibacillus daqingensis]
MEMKPWELYGKVDETMDPVKTNMVATGWGFLVIAVFAIPYIIIWGVENLALTSLLNAVIVAIFLILIHELLHIVGYVNVGGAKMNEVKLGVLWKALAPYAHCKVPLKITHYRIAILLPIVLGVVPITLAYLNGNGFLAIIGILMMTASVGDLMVIHVLRKYKKDAYVQDHPSKIGCVVYVPKE